uniref:hypothetical protein n=1 Tax=Gelidibacter sp. TaxID=2018083 RepID=UPI00404A13FA
MAEKYINESVSKKIEKYGMTFVEIEDNSFHIEFFKKRNITYVAKNFSEKISDSLLNYLFNEKQIDHYEEQLIHNEFNVNEFHYNNSKYKKYNDLLKRADRNTFYKVYVSKPFFTLNKDYGFIFTLVGGHSNHLVVLKKVNNKWNYYFSYLIN